MICGFCIDGNKWYKKPPSLAGSRAKSTIAPLDDSWHRKPPSSTGSRAKLTTAALDDSRHRKPPSSAGNKANSLAALDNSRHEKFSSSSKNRINSLAALDNFPLEKPSSASSRANSVVSLDDSQHDLDNDPPVLQIRRLLSGNSVDGKNNDEISPKHQQIKRGTSSMAVNRPCCKTFLERPSHRVSNIICTN